MASPHAQMGGAKGVPGSVGRNLSEKRRDGSQNLRNVGAQALR